MKRLYNVLLGFLTVTTICGCNEGDNDINSDTHNQTENATEITLAEYIELIASNDGVWLIDGELNQTDDDNSSNTPIDVNTLTITPFIIKKDPNSDSVTTTSCSAEAAKTMTIEEIADNEEDGSNDSSFCGENENFTYSYFKLSDQHVRVNHYCANKAIGSYDIKQLSTNSSFNLGSLSFQSDLYPDLTTNSTNTCGNTILYNSLIKHSTLDSTKSDENILISMISVASHYNDNRIEFTFGFPTDNLVPGVYEVTTENIHEGSDYNNLKIVMASVSSKEFGGTDDDPYFLSGNSGTVTITEASDYSATGSFYFTTYNNATFTGQFTYNLN